MLTPETIQTFNITFKCNYHVYKHVMEFLEHYSEVISDSVLADTEKLYEDDPTFRKLVKAVKEANDKKLDYINKFNR